MIKQENNLETLLSLYGCPPPKWYTALKDMPENRSGVYILVHADEPQYVGTSVMTRNRVSQHLRRGFPADRIGLVEVAGVLREVIEVAVIGLLNPRFNQKWNSRWA